MIRIDILWIIFPADSDTNIDDKDSELTVCFVTNFEENMIFYSTLEHGNVNSQLGFGRRGRNIWKRTAKTQSYSYS